MANSLGSLVVMLGLNAAEYTRGLTKAEAQAKQFAQNTRAAIMQVGAVLGGLGIGAAILESSKAIVAEAAALNDLADATGSSVEALSRLNNQAKIAGTDFATLQSALLKMSQGMAGTDEETTKTKEALKLLGVTAKDPAQALQDVALALNKYEDGINKVGLAVAIFGKQGAALLPTLKDMAELQDVQATVTTKQARAAEELEKQWRRLGVEGTTFKNIILSDVVPALLNAIEDMKEGTRIAGGFFQALLLFGGLNPFQTPAQGIADLRRELEALQRMQAKGRAFDFFNEIPGEIETKTKQLRFLLSKVAQEARAAISPEDTNVRDQILARKPQAPALPGGGAGGRAKALKEATDEGLRYQQGLERQLQATLDLSHEETARIAILDAMARGEAGFTAARNATIIDMARQLDVTKALEKADQERKKAEDDAAKTRERTSQQTTRDIETEQRNAQAMRDGNEQLKEQLIFLKGGQEALDAYTIATNAKAAALLEDRAAMEANAGGAQAMIDALRAQAAALRERNALIGDVKLLEQMKKEAAALQDVKNMFSNALVDPLADFVTGTKSAKDAFKDFINSVSQQLARIASQNVANALFGGNSSSGPDVFGVLGKLFAGMMGGGGGTGVGFSGGGFGEHFAGGGISRGGFALVGERGPELVDLPRGARVLPAEKTERMLSPNMNITVNPPAGMTRQSAQQFAVMIGSDITRRMKRA